MRTDPLKPIIHRARTASAALLCTAALATGACSSGAKAARPSSSSRSPALATPTSLGVRASAGDTVAFCKLITANNAILSDIAAGDSNSNGVDQTKLAQDLDAAVATAPADIKGDMQTIVAFDRQIMTTHTEIKETPQLAAAMQHYATWTRSHCVAGKAP